MIDQLASAAEATAEQVRAEDAVAGASLDELAAPLRREGLDAFVQ